MDRPAESLTPSGGDAGGVPHRPRELALLLLAIGTDPPRARARDQQADRAGGALLRRILDRLAALDPEPADLDAALTQIVTEIGEPTGPARGVCSQIVQEWNQTLASPGAWAWLLSEAIDCTARGDHPGPKHGRRRGPA